MSAKVLQFRAPCPVAEARRMVADFRQVNGWVLSALESAENALAAGDYEHAYKQYGAAGLLLAKRLAPALQGAMEAAGELVPPPSAA